MLKIPFLAIVPESPLFKPCKPNPLSLKIFFVTDHVLGCAWKQLLSINKDKLYIYIYIYTQVFCVRIWNNGWLIIVLPYKEGIHIIKASVYDFEALESHTTTTVFDSWLNLNCDAECISCRCMLAISAFIHKHSKNHFPNWPGRQQSLTLSQFFFFFSVYLILNPFFHKLKTSNPKNSYDSSFAFMLFVFIFFFK